MFRNLKISTKIIALTTVLAIFFLGGSFGIVVFESREELLSASIETLEVEVNNQKNTIDAILGEVKNTVLVLKNTPPFQGLIRARKGNGFDTLENSTDLQWKKRMQSIFAAQIEATGLYDQLRYIDEEGMEVVRVNYDGERAVVVPEEELQSKGDRDYFIEAKDLIHNEIYISYTELNKEGSPPKISVPYRPVIRYATPVLDEITGERKGILIANVLVNELVAKTQIIKNENIDIYVINKDGAFIVHPDPSKEWGGEGDLATGITLETEFPEIAEVLSSDTDQSQVVGRNVFSFIRVYPELADAGRSWTVFTLLPLDVLFESIDTILIKTALFGLGIFILSFFIFVFAIKYLLRPLQSLTEGAEALGRGIFSVKISVDSHDEIGRLAEVFNETAKQLSSLYASLEQRVQEKTEALNKKLKELQGAQHAMGNVLEDIENEKEKISTILKSIGDGVFVIDAELNIVLINEVAADIAGVSIKESVGKPYKDVLHFEHEDSGEVNDVFVMDAIRKGVIQEMTNHTVLVRSDGLRIPVADSAAPLKTPEGVIEGVVVVFRDVSREYAIDKAKTEFVSLASHQLRTPLTAIGWYVEMLQSGDAGPLTEQQEDFLREIATGNRRMVDLVNALLNTSRIDMGTFAVDPEETDVILLAEEIIEEFKHQADERGVTLTTTYASDIPKMNVDPKLMGIVFQNILSNAVKYTPNGGLVTMELVTDKKNLVLTVVDTGYGIPEKQQDKVFEKLFRADNVREKDTEGTGLGLYIVKSIIDEAGGRIWFESEENVGTTFHVTLPLEGMKRKEGAKGLS